MNPNVEQEVDDIVRQWAYQDTHADIVAKNALEMNKKLAQALAYYYNPTTEEYRQFDEHCEAISAAGGCPPDPVEYWGHLAFNHWQYLTDPNQETS